MRSILTAVGTYVAQLGEKKEESAIEEAALKTLVYDAKIGMPDRFEEIEASVRVGFREKGAEAYLGRYPQAIQDKIRLNAKIASK